MQYQPKQSQQFFSYFAHNYLTSTRITSLYYGHDLQDFLARPFNSFAKLSQQYFNVAALPLSHTKWDNVTRAQMSVFERMTHHYLKPKWDLKDFVNAQGQTIHIEPENIIKKDFCTLVHFQKYHEGHKVNHHRQPVVLIVAPYSGHYATLLRDTVQRSVVEHDIYITDWVNARDVPIYKGQFNFDSYVQYLLDFLIYLDRPVHIIAVCQPAVPVLALSALLAQDNSPYQPQSITLMGGPIDTRYTPTEVNKFARAKSIDWFYENIVGHVPYYHRGSLRPVVPGFILLAGFIHLNLEKHLNAPYSLFEMLVKGDKNSAEAHAKFYNEYRAVLDLPAEYYMDSVQMVFKEFLLPRGKMKIWGNKVDLKAITKTALMTVEGERDDISGPGQTYAAHNLCSNLTDDMKHHYCQQGVGHYGVFNGHRWRDHIYPQVAAFIKAHNK